VATRLIILCLMCFLLQNWAHIEDFAQLCYNPTPSLVSVRTVFWRLLVSFRRVWHPRGAYLLRWGLLPPAPCLLPDAG
jgi:hypothetical protein